MKKIATVFLTACVLLCLATGLFAKVWEIQIKVENGAIEMGEKYAYAVPERAVIRWTCDSPFYIVFDSYAPFEEATVSEPTIPKNVKTIVKKAKPEAKPNVAYKYTIVVFPADGQTLALDPVIIIIPPRM
jgi:hypothetical protein